MDVRSLNDNIGGTPLPDIPSSPEWTPRISPDAFIGIQFALMAVAIVTAAGRTFLRVRNFRRITLDDALLWVAVCFLVAATVVSYLVTSLVYWTTYSNLGLVKPVSNLMDILRVFSIMDNLADVFGWGAIFTVKISFLLFLRQLVDRVQLIRIWWWVVFVFVIGSTPVTMFLGFYICPYFGPDMMEKCGTQVVPRQIIFLTINCVLDIVSDALILSIPCWLLWKVQIGMQRKLALGTILCLSIFMIIIAIIRVALDPIHLENGRTGPDTPWLYFWTNVEAAVAIVMVSLTAFRSMLGQEGSTRKAPSSGDPWSSTGSKVSRPTRLSPSPGHYRPGAYPLTRPESADSAREFLPQSNLPQNVVDHRHENTFTHAS